MTIEQVDYMMQCIFAIRFSLMFKLPLVLCGITWICFHRPLLDLMAIGTQAA